MHRGKTVACVIPARLASTRFPKKMLAHLAGKPLLQWVWEAASSIQLFDSVQFAVDVEETLQLVQSFGATAYMTSSTCRCGTERLIELKRRKLVEAEVWVNWQGDEPLIRAPLIQDLLQSCDRSDIDVWTLCKKIEDLSEIASPHIAKVVAGAGGRALFFSRSPLPYSFPEDPLPLYWKHVGVYAFRQEALDRIATFSEPMEERAERLEQLRWLHHGLNVQLHETEQIAFGIDLPHQLAIAEEMLLARTRQPANSELVAVEY